MVKTMALVLGVGLTERRDHGLAMVDQGHGFGLGWSSGNVGLWHGSGFKVGFISRMGAKNCCKTKLG